MLHKQLQDGRESWMEHGRGEGSSQHGPVEGPWHWLNDAVPRTTAQCSGERSILSRAEASQPLLRTFDEGEERGWWR